MTVTIRSSSQQVLKDPVLLQRELDAGHVVELADLKGAVVVRPEDVIALADQIAEEELLEEMVTYRKNVTGVDHTIFISPRGKTRHAARVKVAIDPPDSVDPQGNVAVIAVSDGRVVHGDVPPRLLTQVQQFIDLNRELLIEYWNAYDTKVDTEDLRQRLKKIP
jgi:NAD(P)H-dependent FMN reductase